MGQSCIIMHAYVNTGLIRDSLIYTSILLSQFVFSDVILARLRDKSLHVGELQVSSPGTKL